MAGEITHRGPDDSGFFTTPTAGLAFRRLSIIDLSGGHQPIGNEDGTIQVILNGEVDGFRGLRFDESAVTVGEARSIRTGTNGNQSGIREKPTGKCGRGQELWE